LIHIRRDDDKVPATLKSQTVVDTKNQIQKIAAQRKPASDEFPAHWGKDDVRTALWEMQHKKCCYCERKREKNRESDVEHFRPKADVTEADTTHKGYWWLAYEWKNLFFSCRYCNQQHKKNHFPVTGTHASSPNDPLQNEGALLIDPTDQAPETLIGYDWFLVNKDYHVYAVPRRDSVEGRKTIKVLGLNQNEIPLERGHLVWDLITIADLMRAGLQKENKIIVDKMARRIAEQTTAKQPFAGFRRDFFRKQSLDEYIVPD
jgi:uncharacterized protein (TIGR02646 family)